ncbi:spore maturation protein, partial [Clostridiaceae bacterium UIB06]|nr:spore maturation protein [Clostridiaceae bacterium UIB06]
MNYITSAIIPIIVVSVVTYGIVKGVKVYECFVEGAKDGLSICLR